MSKPPESPNCDTRPSPTLKNLGRNVETKALHLTSTRTEPIITARDDGARVIAPPADRGCSGAKAPEREQAAVNVRIRPAQPDDAPFLARVCLMASRSHCQRGVWDIILGRPESECLLFLEHLVATETRHPFHYAGFIVGEADSRPGAALSGYDPKELGHDTEELGCAEAGQKTGITLSDWESKQRGISTVSAVRPDDAEEAWIVESVATVPEFRRRGLVDSLLEAILETGRLRGLRVAQVGVFIGNTPALNAYEKCGFRFVDEKRHPDFEAETGCPGIARLLRAL